MWSEPAHDTFQAVEWGSMRQGRYMEGDAAYFFRRASEERAAAMRSANPHARQSHLELARRYDDLVTAIEAQQTRLVLPLAG